MLNFNHLTIHSLTVINLKIIKYKEKIKTTVFYSYAIVK